MSNCVLVLGSNSFAGSCTIKKLLEEQIKVIGVSRTEEPSNIMLPHKWWKDQTNYRFKKININTEFELLKSLIQKHPPDYVIDFAGQGMVAESWANPYQWYQTNIVSKAKLHGVLLDNKKLKKYIRISTPEVYGNTVRPISEAEAKLNPSTPYALSHACIDQSLSLLHKQFSFPMVIGRFANFYGPGQQLYRIIPRTIIYGLEKKCLSLHGGGTSIRAFIHGSDVADGVFKLVQKGVIGETYHFSPDDFFSIKDVIELICRKIDVPFSTFVKTSADRPGKDSAYFMSSSKANHKLGWKNKKSLDQGIDETVLWIKKNLNQIMKLPLEYIHKS